MIHRLMGFWISELLGQTFRLAEFEFLNNTYERIKSSVDQVKSELIQYERETQSERNEIDDAFSGDLEVINPTELARLKKSQLKFKRELKS